MSGVLDLSSGHFTSTYDGNLRFSTETKGLFNKVPSAVITLSNYDVTFPDLEYTVIYYLAREIRNIGGTDFVFHGSHSWTQLIPAEYGPSETGLQNIPDIIVGSVPTGTNYLDIRASVEQTVAPSWLMVSDGFTFALPTNEALRIEGGSLILSRDFYVRRMVSFHISGTDLILRRRVSVGSRGSNWLNLTTNESTFDRFSTRESNPATNPRAWGSLGTLIDSVEVGGRTITEAKRDGSESSSTDAVAAGISYSCTYNCDFTITPCRIQD